MQEEEEEERQEEGKKRHANGTGSVEKEGERTFLKRLGGRSICSSVVAFSTMLFHMLTAMEPMRDMQAKLIHMLRPTSRQCLLLFIVIHQ